MSDETSAALPQVPPPPTQPGESVVLKVPPGQDGPQSAAPQSAAQDPAQPEGTGVAEELPQAASDGSEASGDDAANDGAVSGPLVANNADGQTVTLEDGTVVHTRTHPYPVSNAEWEQYELTHSGDQLRYSFVPGDKEYNPYSDPAVPNSHMANMVEREIASYSERVLTNPNAPVSSIWNSFKGVYEGELEQAVATGGGNSDVEA